MQPFRSISLAIVCVALHLFIDSSVAGDVVVKGTTLAVTQDPESDAFKYGLLPNVKIQAFRGGPIFKEPKSSRDGLFEFLVPGGGPFDLVFYLDQNKVPQMQSLAGASDIGHEFHVCLLTVEQYRKLEERGLQPPLWQRVQSINNLAQGDPELAGVNKQILSLLDKKK